MTFSNQRGESMRGYPVPMPSLNRPNAVGGRSGSGNQRGESMRGYGLSMPSFPSLQPGTIRGGNRGAQPGASPAPAPSRAMGLPDNYKRQELEMSARAGGQGLQVAPVPRPPAPRPAPVVPTYSQPAAVSSGDFAQDYRVPAGSTPMPSAAPTLPQGSTASRANAVLAPIGAARNSDLIQVAGNAGVQLIDPGAVAMFQQMASLPASSEDGARRMLSEFGGDRPAMTATPVIDTSGMNAAATLSPETLQAAAGGFRQAPSGDRFAHLRPDIAEWARHHENSAKGVDGLNIVDRFMAKQGVAPPAAPVAMPAAMAVDPAAAFAPQQGLLPTRGPEVGLSAEQQTNIGNAFAQPAESTFDAQANLVDQVQLLRELYRNNSRPNPGTAGPRP